MGGQRVSRLVVRQIWTPQDSVDTAQAFALELHNAERGARYCARCDKSQLVVKVDPDGVCRRCKRRSRVERFMFSRSRFRRAGILDTLTVGLLVVVLAALGYLYLVAYAPTAKADVTDPQVIAFTAAFGGVVCSVLDDGHATPAGVYGISQGIVEESGLSYYQAGQVIGLSVAEICPRHLAPVKAFAKSSPGEYA